MNVKLLWAGVQVYVIWDTLRQQFEYDIAAVAP